MSEAQFIAEVAEQADCDLLLDINNVYVSCVNHGHDAQHYLSQLPHHRVRQIHLAGHESKKDYLLDSHGAPIAEPVLELYRQFIQQAGPIPALIEWDTQLPSFAHLLQECNRINEINESIAVTNNTTLKQGAQPVDA